MIYVEKKGCLTKNNQYYSFSFFFCNVYKNNFSSVKKERYEIWGSTVPEQSSGEIVEGFKYLVLNCQRNLGRKRCKYDNCIWKTKFSGFPLSQTGSGFYSSFSRRILANEISSYLRNKKIHACFFWKKQDTIALQLPKDCRTCIYNKIFLGFAYLVPTNTTFIGRQNLYSITT